MFGGTTNVQQLEWHQLIKHYEQLRLCSIEYLCREFPLHFRCNYGKLKVINLIGQHMNRTLDLSALPPSVEKLRVSQNSLTYIFGLNQLSDKRLVHLAIRNNPYQLDLRALEQPALESWCRYWSRWGLIPHLGELSMVRLHSLARNCVEKSILNTMWIGHNHYRISCRKKDCARYDLWLNLIESIAMWFTDFKISWMIVDSYFMIRCSIFLFNSASV